MDTTSSSLLEQLRQSSDPAWDSFARLYTPLLFSWTRRLGLREQAAADLVQEVFVVLLHKLPQFRYDRDRSFRGWLWSVLRSTWLDLCKRRGTAEPEANGVFPEPICPDGTEDVDEAEYRQYLVRRAMQIMQSDFQPATWQACWEHVVNDRPAAEVAAELGISAGAVYVATNRVLCRLRQELAGLLD